MTHQTAAVAVQVAA